MESDKGKRIRQTNVTVRRSLEQAKHCLEEALSVLANNEDPRNAWEDIHQAHDLIVSTIKPGIEKIISAPKSLSDLIEHCREEHREGCKNGKR